VAPAFIEPTHLADNIARKRPGRDQLFRDAGEQAIQNLASAGQQAVRVAVLWHAAPILATGGKDIALHQRHTIVVIGENTSSQQTSHASANYDCVTAARFRHYFNRPSTN
jgi:hypothetical protein